MILIRKYFQNSNHSGKDNNVELTKKPNYNEDPKQKNENIIDSYEFGIKHTKKRLNLKKSLSRTLSLIVISVRKLF
jgi:hypothetical protein